MIFLHLIVLGAVFILGVGLIFGTKVELLSNDRLVIGDGDVILGNRLILHVASEDRIVDDLGFVGASRNRFDLFSPIGEKFRDISFYLGDFIRFLDV